MFRVKEGSTAQLLQFCAGYFTFYVITGLSVKYFLQYSNGPHFSGMENLVYSTFGGMMLATVAVIVLKWYRLHSLKSVTIAGVSIPQELLYIIPSGFFTAIIIPTTTLMYSFKGISVMVAMLLMRGSVIIISRIVDSIQIRQGILKKSVLWEENVAIAFALSAVFINLFKHEDGKQSMFSSLPVMVVFSLYIVSYAIRIYIMNYYKNTRKADSKVNNNKAFFAIEQLSSSTFILLATVTVVLLVKQFGFDGFREVAIVDTIFNPRAGWWYYGVLAGMAFGIVAFFSVFIFMFKGRTATFSGLVNRLTSLVAGTASTLLFALFFGGHFPKMLDWIALVLIFTAVGFMAKAEKRRKSL